MALSVGLLRRQLVEPKSNLQLGGVQLSLLQTLEQLDHAVNGLHAGVPEPSLKLDLPAVGAGGAGSLRVATGSGCNRWQIMQERKSSMDRER